MTPPSLDTFPGWRPDPEAPGRERFWNGIAWTDKVRVAPEAPPRSGDRTASAPGPSTDDRPRREIATADGIVILADSSAATGDVGRRARSLDEPSMSLDSAPPPVGQRPLRIGAITPEADPSERRDVIESSKPSRSGRPSAGESKPEGQSIFASESDAAPFEAARSVRLPVTPPQRRSSPTLTRWVVPFLCLLVAAAAGFAVGYAVADTEPAPVQAPSD